MPEAGWYTDPSDSALARWHDGAAFTAHTVTMADHVGPPPPPATWTAPPAPLPPPPGRPVFVQAPAGPPSVAKKGPNGCLIALAVVGALVVLAGILGAIGLAASTKDSNGNHIPDIVENGPLSNDDAKNMSFTEFGEIQSGMTLDEVVTIVGGPGSLQAHTDIAGYSDDIYSWDGNGALGANANVTFQNGKVFSKAQFGLK